MRLSSCTASSFLWGESVSVSEPTRCDSRRHQINTLTHPCRRGRKLQLDWLVEISTHWPGVSVTSTMLCYKQELLKIYLRTYLLAQSRSRLWRVTAVFLHYLCVCVSMKTTLVSTCSSECVLSSPTVILSWSQWLLCGFVTQPLLFGPVYLYLLNICCFEIKM